LASRYRTSYLAWRSFRRGRKERSNAGNKELHYNPLLACVKDGACQRIGDGKRERWVPAQRAPGPCAPGDSNGWEFQLADLVRSVRSDAQTSFAISSKSAVEDFMRFFLSAVSLISALVILGMSTPAMA
jgi:hypothetical protein